MGLVKGNTGKWYVRWRNQWQHRVVYFDLIEVHVNRLDGLEVSLALFGFGVVIEWVPDRLPRGN